MAGLSQRQTADAAGTSHSQLSRIEHGDLRTVSIERILRVAFVLGLDLSVRLYPDGQPVRDRAHLDLIGRFVERLPNGAEIRAEVAIPIAGDRRAWDLQILGLRRPTAPGSPDGRAGIEAETRLADLQALIRRTSLKARDSGIGTVILLVSDTRTNRRILREFELVVREAFPISGREALTALAEGRDPGGWSVVML